MALHSTECPYRNQVLLKLIVIPPQNIHHYQLVWIKCDGMKNSKTVISIQKVNKSLKLIL